MELILSASQMMGDLTSHKKFHLKFSQGTSATGLILMQYYMSWCNKRLCQNMALIQNIMKQAGAKQTLVMTSLLIVQQHTFQ